MQKEKEAQQLAPLRLSNRTNEMRNVELGQKNLELEAGSLVETIARNYRGGWSRS
jgi:hypothetical protein